MKAVIENVLEITKKLKFICVEKLTCSHTLSPTETACLCLDRISVRRYVIYIGKDGHKSMRH